MRPIVQRFIVLSLTILGIGCIPGCGGNKAPEIPVNTPAPPPNDPGPATAGPPVKPIQAN